MYAALELGCDGGILGVACFAAASCAALLAAFRAGDRARAGKLQERLGPLDKEVVGKLGPAGVKAAMDAGGLYGGPVRPPLAPVAPGERERVAKLVGPCPTTRASSPTCRSPAPPRPRRPRAAARAS